MNDAIWRRSSSALVALVAVVALIVSGCGSEGGSAAERRRPSVVPQAGAKRDAAAFRAALMTMPILDVANLGPANPAVLVHTADLFVTGTIVGVERGGTRTFGTADSRAETVAVRVTATSIWDVKSKAKVGRDQEVTFEITVGSSDNTSNVDASIARMVDTAPVGSSVVLYLIHSKVGDFLQLAHPSAWALVGADGRLESLAVDPGAPPGLGGIEGVEQLPK